jgi:serine/threonine-protein kinase ATR
VQEFLVDTQAHTLPWLVLARKIDIIAKISQARNDDEPGQAIIANLGPIITLLLVQPISDPESFVMGLFRSVSPEFDNLDLTECIKMATIEIAAELLKNAGDEEDSKKSRVGSSFHSWLHSLINANRFDMLLMFSQHTPMVPLVRVSRARERTESDRY